ncbi:MAG TPA: amidohydrolase family protein [Acidimicrobiia bacterium]|nr:amidohydrolase family protein [Acidimicrobiia bacterium]
MTTTLVATLCAPGPPTPGWLVLGDGVIVDMGAGAVAAGPDIVDLGDALLVPGLLDLQVNGVGEVDFARADGAAWQRARAALVRGGTTGFCPTLVSAALDSYEPWLTEVAAIAADDDGAAILGVHLEGPFLGGAPGAHPVELLRPAEPVWLEKLLDAVPGLVRIVTLAPEADPDLFATRLLAGRAVVVALGHSTASYDDVMAAADAGASVVTHLFNGMGPFHQRAPGLIGAALSDPRLTPTIIADLVHVHPAALRLAIAAKDSLGLVTDAVAVGTAIADTARPDQDGVPRLADGTLVGSTLTLDRAVRNVVGLGVPVARAVEMATAVPADVLGLRDRGRLAPGARADLVALDPTTLEVRAVWLEGEQVVG